MGMERSAGDGQKKALAASAAVAMNRDEEGKELLVKEAVHPFKVIPAAGADMVFKLGYEQEKTLSIDHF